MRFLVFLLLWHFVWQVRAQTEPLYTTYFFQPAQINPAAGSMRNSIETGVVARFQYTGLTNRISSTQGFDFSMHLPAARSVIGLRVNNDFIGLQRSTWVAAQYAYRMPFRRCSLSLGIEAGMIQMALDGSRMVTPEGSYQSGNINHNDPFLSSSLQQAVAPMFSGGVMVHGERFFSGISLQQIAWSNAYFPSVGGRGRVTFTRVMTIHGGYSIALGRRFSIQPSLLVRTDWVKWQGEINVFSTLWDNIYFGLSLRGYNQRSFESVSAQAGYRFLRRYIIVYAYDGSISPLRSFQGGSHELTLRMSFSLKPSVKEGFRYHIPRFL